MKSILSGEPQDEIQTARRGVSRPQGNAAYWDAVSAAYFQRYEEASPAGFALRTRRERLLELLDGLGGKALDVGCGPGILVQALRDRGYDVWGVDASPHMIQLCHRSFGATEGAHFVVGDATSLPFPDEYFDVVICAGVIGNVRAGETAIVEMARVVKKQGTLLISFPNLLSPYAAWKTFVFYPVMAVLRPIYHRLACRPPSPSLYDLSWCRRRRSLLTSLADFHTVGNVRDVMCRHGIPVEAVVYFSFNLFLSPLDELFPRSTLAVIERLERLRFGALKWLGTGFIVKAQRC